MLHNNLVTERDVFVPQGQAPQNCVGVKVIDKVATMVQADSAMTWNKDVNLSRRQFCFDLAEIFLVFFKEHDATI